MSYYKPNFNTILTILVAILATTLLTFQRIDTPKHQSALVDDIEYSRGEIVSSGNEFVKIDFADSQIWLDKKTEVKIVSGIEGEETINVIQGRVVVDGKLSIQTRAGYTRIDGKTSFVHYSWRDEIEVAVMNGVAEHDWNITVPITHAERISTQPPHLSQEIDFNPDESIAAEFYNQAK